MDINCELIKNYIKHISSETDCHIIINDNLHILKNMSEFKDVPEISRWHTNEYCMKIKENIKLHRRCVYLKKYYDKKVTLHNGSFKTTCYCGVTEIVVPVKLYGVDIISVCASAIKGEISNKMVEILSHRVNLTPKGFINIRDNALVSNYDEDKLKIHLETLACMLKVYLQNNISKKVFEENHIKQTETAEYIKKASEYIDRHFTENIKVKDVADFCNLSASHLQHLFIETTGKGIGDKIRINRLHYARQLLRTTNRSIKNIAIFSGFKNTDYFSYAFHKEFGITPLKYKKSFL